MRKNARFVALLGLVALFSGLALFHLNPTSAQEGGIEASVTDAATARAVDPNTGEPQGITDLFEPGTARIYFVAKATGPTGTNFTTRWTRIADDGNASQEIATVRLVINEDIEEPQWIWYWVDLQGGWPVGSYRVTLTINGEEALSVEFRVGEAGPEPAAPLTVRLADPGGSGSFSFDPSEFTFTAGQTVDFMLTAETVAHTFTVHELGIDVVVEDAETEEFTYTFDEAGTYRLVCRFHEAFGMVGSITVTPPRESKAPAPLMEPPPRPDALPVVGPMEGELAHNDDEFIEELPAASGLSDLDVEASFANPFPPGEGVWDYGFIFRNPEPNVFHAVVVNGSGQWFHVVRLGRAQTIQIAANGFSDVIDTAPDGGNSLRLVALGSQGWLYVNGSLVTMLDLSALETPGQVSAITGFFVGSELPGAVTRVEGLSVWDLSGGQGGQPALAQVTRRSDYGGS